MKQKPKNIEGKQLIDTIKIETIKRNCTLRDIAGEIGVSYIHMTSLTGGARKISGLSPDKQRKLAKILNISMLDFFLMAEMLRKEDLIQIPA